MEQGMITKPNIEGLYQKTIEILESRGYSRNGPGDIQWIKDVGNTEYRVILGRYQIRVESPCESSPTDFSYERFVADPSDCLYV